MSHASAATYGGHTPSAHRKGSSIFRTGRSSSVSSEQSDSFQKGSSSSAGATPPQRRGSNGGSHAGGGGYHPFSAETSLQLSRGAPRPHPAARLHPFHPREPRAPRALTSWPTAASVWVWFKALDMHAG